MQDGARGARRPTAARRVTGGGFVTTTWTRRALWAGSAAQQRRLLVRVTPAAVSPRPSANAQPLPRDSPARTRHVPVLRARAAGTEDRPLRLVRRGASRRVGRSASRLGAPRTA